MKSDLRNFENLAKIESDWTVAGNDEKYKLILFRVYEKRIERVWQEFEENNLEPILLKGWRAAQYYPKPHLRTIGDIDIAVNPKRFEIAEKLLKTLPEREIDLHKGLKYLDNADWVNVYSNSIQVKCGNTLIRVLRPEDDLRVLCTHWLIDSGVNREKLWDIYYAFDNRQPNFDWGRFLDTAGAKRRRWLICAIGITHKYLGLDIENTPLSEEAKHLPKWLTRAIEKEWESTVKFRYLHRSLNNPREFLDQVKKRFPPNPIQATIEMEGHFDDKPRIIYQMPNMFYRLFPSIKRMLRLIISPATANKDKPKN
jgi:hypothetical protein